MVLVNVSKKRQSKQPIRGSQTNKYPVYHRQLRYRLIHVVSGWYDFFFISTDFDGDGGASERRFPVPKAGKNEVKLCVVEPKAVLAVKFPAADVGLEAMIPRLALIGNFRRIMLSGDPLGVSGPIVSRHGDTADDNGSDETAQAFGKRVGAHPQPSPVGRTCGNRIGVGTRQFADTLAPRPASRRADFSMNRDDGFVSFSRPTKDVACERGHCLDGSGANQTHRLEGPASSLLVHRIGRAVFVDGHRLRQLKTPENFQISANELKISNDRIEE